MATDAQSESAVQAAPAKSGKVRFILVLTLVMVTAGALAGGAVFYLMSSASNDQDSSSDGAGVPLAEPIYVELAPPFTVNFRGARGPRFLQISLQVMTREAEVEDLLMQHMPAIRNQLVLLFSSQSSEQLDSREGKEQLIQETLQTIQGVLKQASGKEGIEAVYFTSLVMQ